MGAALRCLTQVQEPFALGHGLDLLCRQAQSATCWRRANG